MAESDFQKLSPLWAIVNLKFVLIDLLIQNKIAKNTYDKFVSHLKDQQNKLKDQQNEKSQQQTQSNSTEGSLEFSLDDVTMIVYGLADEHVFERIQDLNMVFQDQLIETIKLTHSEFNCLQQSIIQYLRLYTYRHDCNIATVGTFNGQLQIYQKRRCRAQIEFLKRLINFNKKQSNLLTKSSQNKSKLTSGTASEFLTSSLFQNEEQSIQIDLLDNDDQQKVKQMEETDQIFKQLKCCSLIDYIQMQVKLLVYHQQDPMIQYLFEFKLPNINNTKTSHPEFKNDINSKLKDTFIQYFKEKSEINFQVKFIFDWDNCGQDFQNQFIVKSGMLIPRYKDISKSVQINKLSPPMLFHIQSEYGSDIDAKLEKLNDNKQIQFLSKIDEHSGIHESGIEHLKYGDFTTQHKILISTTIFHVHQNSDKALNNQFMWPMVYVDKDLKSTHFVMTNETKIYAMKSLHIDDKQILNGIQISDKTRPNMQSFIKMCVSSDIILIEEQGTKYQQQNYTVAVHFVQNARFIFYEYNVRWRPKPEKDQENEAESEHWDPQVTINLIKLRQLVLTRRRTQYPIHYFTLVPLFFEKNSENSEYKIVGVQLIGYTEEGNYHHIDFPNMTNENDDKIMRHSQNSKQNKVLLRSMRSILMGADQDQKSPLIQTQTKTVFQHLFEGVYAECQFLHVKENDTNSQYINAELFNDWESYQILYEANMYLLNAVTNDYVDLMDMPNLNQKWFQKTNQGEYMEFKSLDADQIFKGNKKRFFSPCQALSYQNIFNQYSLQSKIQTKNDQNDDQNASDKRNLNNIIKLFEKLKKQQKDFYYDFKFLKSMETPRFALTLIEKVIRYDKLAERYKTLKTSNILMNNVFWTDLEQVSILQKPLDHKDDIMFDVYLKYMFANDVYNEFEYSQIMRILPYVLKQFNLEDFMSSQFFKFFKNNEKTQIEVDDDSENQSLDNMFFRANKKTKDVVNSTNCFQLGLFFPDEFEDLIDRYTNKELQIFKGQHFKDTEKDTAEMFAYHNIINEYKPQGFDFEVKAQWVNFKQYNLGNKLMKLYAATSVSEIKAIGMMQFDDCEMARMIKEILNLTSGQIEEQKIIRNIIDYEFQYTQKFFIVKFVVYLSCFFIPFTLQMMCQHQNQIKAYNILCLVCQISFFSMECLRLFEKNPRKVFDRTIQSNSLGRIIINLKRLMIFIWNHIYQIAYLFNSIQYFHYFYKRMSTLHMGIDLMPVIPDELKDINSQIPSMDQQKMDTFFESLHSHTHCFFIVYGSKLLHLSIFFVSFLQLQSWLKCVEQFAEQVELIKCSFRDIRYFLLFFFLWVLVFAKIFYFTGFELDDEEYPNVPKLAYLLHTFRGSIGESTTPKYTYWEELDRYEVSVKQKQGIQDATTGAVKMMYIIWFIWFANLFINMIILLNFLIAIISQSYEQVISNKLVFRYKYKAELNKERLTLISKLPKFLKRDALGTNLKPYDIFSIVSRTEEAQQKDLNEINGMTYNLKIYIKNQIESLYANVNNQIQRNENSSIKRYNDQSGKINEILQLFQSDKEVRNHKFVQDQKTNFENKFRQKWVLPQNTLPKANDQIQFKEKMDKIEQKIDQNQQYMMHLSEEIKEIKKLLIQSQTANKKEERLSTDEEKVQDLSKYQTFLKSSEKIIEEDDAKDAVVSFEKAVDDDDEEDAVADEHQSIELNE